MMNLVLRDIHQGAQKTLLIATHRPEEAMTLCNKLMVIDGGHVKGFVNLARLPEEGTTVLDFYRRCIAGETAA
jgi:ABC-type sugar transport system ATPase subunit